MAKKKAPTEGRMTAKPANNASRGGGATKAQGAAPAQQESQEPAARPEPASESLDTPVIVGIGSSAGGLNAVGELLRNLPTETDMAFVVVQHLDPHHDSAMADLLTRATKMPVTELTDGTVPEPNHVYIIAPN